MLFDAFDHIYIVNLRSRPDRRREMQRQMSLLGLSVDPRVKYFDAIRTADPGPFLRVGSHGAFLSHLSILKSHIHTNETVLILQDDCDFFPNAAQAHIRPDWGIFYGGYHQLDPGDLHLSNIQGAHCMAFRPQIIPRLVEFLEAVYTGSCDPIVEACNRPSGKVIAPPIDGAIVWFRRLNPDVLTVFRQISYQRSSKTDIGDPSVIDRIPLLAVTSRFLLRLYRRARLRFAGGAQS